MWLNLGVGEAYLRWLGGWRSLAWLVYPEVAGGMKSRAAALRAAHLRAGLAHLHTSAQPSGEETEEAFEKGWSMLPFSFFGEGKAEEEYTYSNNNANLAFGMRLWVRFDDRMDSGRVRN